MPTKNGQLAVTTKHFFMITKCTLHVCNNEQMRSLTHRNTVQ